MLKRSIVFMLDNIKYFQVDRIKFDVTMAYFVFCAQIIFKVRIDRKRFLARVT